MVAELTPGTPAAGRLPDGGTIPVSQTLPDVNLDEILASLDADTRDYLRCCSTTAAQALKGNGRELAHTIRRIEPTAKLRPPGQRGSWPSGAANISARRPQLLAAHRRARRQATTRSPTSS